MMSKFSIRPPSYNATRVRENQRRHRARVKERTVSLEVQLAETQSQLEGALAEIARLRQQIVFLECADQAHEQTPEQALDQAPPSGNELQAAPDATMTDHGGTTTQEDAGDSGATANTGEANQGADEDWGMSGCGTATTPPVATGLEIGATGAVGNDTMAAIESMRRLSIDQGPDLAISPTVGQGATASPETPVFGVEDDFIKYQLPALRPGESTTPCADAYKIIEQQNYSALDMEAIHTWLAPGYRQGMRKLDGCRVETNLLFSLLDRISSCGTDREGSVLVGGWSQVLN